MPNEAHIKIQFDRPKSFGIDAGSSSSFVEHGTHLTFSQEIPV